MRKQITIHPAQADKYTCSLLVISVVLSAMMKKKWNYVDSQEYFIIENLQGHDLQHLVLHCRRSGSSCEDQVCLAEKIRFVLRRRSGSSSDSSCAEDQVRLAEKGHRKLAELVQILVVAMSRMIIRSVRKRNARFLSNRFPSVTQTNICTILFTRSNLVTPRNNIHISRKVTAFCCILLFPSLSFSSSHISGTWCAKRS